MKLFVDNVPNLVVRAIIASHLPSIFCPKSVFAMDPDLVTKIASETEDKRVRRQEISDKLKALEAGNDLCKQYALRITSGQSVLILTRTLLMDVALPILKRTTSPASSLRSSSVASLAGETPDDGGPDSEASEIAN
jgi:hypothetical protein